MSSWIKMIDDSDADEDLNLALNQAKTPHGTVDNVLRVHSLRPSTMIGHMKLYKSVLHDKKNTIPQWFQETISSYVSIINKCKYSYANHWKNAVFFLFLGHPPLGYVILVCFCCIASCCRWAVLRD